VVWDLDNELAEQAAGLGVALARATTPNAQPRFAQLAIDLFDELRLDRPKLRVHGAGEVPGYGTSVNGAPCTTACAG